MVAGKDNLLETDVYNHEAGHAAKHNATNEQLNWLTDQLANPGANPELSASYVALAGTSTPTVIKAAGDTRPGVFEWINNGEGTIFHLLIGSSAVLNQTYAITIGGDNPGNGILLNMKTAGIGLKIEQNTTVTGTDSYGLSVHQANANSPAAAFYTDVNGATDVVRLFSTAGVTNPTQRLLHVIVNTGDTKGEVLAASGLFKWRANVQAFGSRFHARDSSVTADASVSHVYADSDGLDFLSSSGSANLWWRGRVKRDGWAMKLTGTDGFGDASGSGTTERTIIEIAYGGKLGFFGATAINKRATTADATDLASAIALANALKADLVAYGLKS